MTPYISGELRAGAENLLLNCAEIEGGERIVVIHEDPALGWYDLAAPNAVATVARDLGADVDMLQVGGPAAGMPDHAIAAIDAHDVTVFFARVGDQDRFAERDPSHVCVMSYARNADALASPYGRADHKAMVALKDAIDALLFNADTIEISCPLGSKLVGKPPADAKVGVGEVTIRRFPMGVPQPMDARHFSGEAILANFLTPTGSQHYEPASLALPTPVVAKVDGHDIQGFAGDSELVAAVLAHYQSVSKALGIDPFFVHSWHAGIHGACRHGRPAAADADLWSNTVFTSPRFLHFHTCGRYPPGEICWMLQDPTVAIDGRPLWRDGALDAELIQASSDVLARWPALAPILADRPPLAELGL